MNWIIVLIKYLFIVFTIICAILGIAGIVLFAIELTNPSKYKNDYLFLIVLCCLLLIISVFGFCGAIAENVCLLWTYAIFMIVLIIINSLLLFVILWNRNFNKMTNYTLDRKWNQQMKGENAMDEFQTKFKCCGKNGPSDYEKSKKPIPKSCYPPKKFNNKKKLYTTGCKKPLMESFSKVGKLARLYTLGTLITEIFAAICAMLLAHVFRSKHLFDYNLY